MNPNDASANKSVNITQLGATAISIPTNPNGKLVLIRIVVNKKGGSSNTAKVYDDTDANPSNIKATIDTTDKVGHIDYGIPFFNGIYINLTTGSAPDLTVIYKEIA